METFILNNENEVIKKLSEEIEKIANESIQTKSSFRVGLSGGSLVKYLSNGMPSIKTDWAKWKFFFCDERYVSIDDPESTFGMYKNNLLKKIPLKETQFVNIRLNLSLEDCAKDYEKQILDNFEMISGEIPQFDLLLLGVGPDGHTCSLFPDHQLLKENNKLIAHIEDSPKPPSKRVTMTFPIINKAKFCIFALCGASKANVVKKIFVDKEPLPASLVNLKSGLIKCIVDKEAGRYLLQ